MLARWARVAPAWVRDRPGSVYLTSSFESACTTDTPRFSGTLSEPFAPLMVTCSGDTVAVTPFGSSTGAFAILDMMLVPTSGDDAQNFAALTDLPGLLVRHHTLGCGHDHRAHATQNLRQLVLAAINPQPGTADTLDPVDHRAALVVLQANGQRRLAAVRLGAEVGDVTFVLQHLDDGRLQLRRSQLHLRLSGGLAVADASQQ